VDTSRDPSQAGGARLGKTVVIVSHDERLTPVADRIVELCDGRLVGDHG
jgi:ABC-type siderophore export system fused ATPase/permease subunit